MQVFCGERDPLEWKQWHLKNTLPSPSYCKNSLMSQALRMLGFSKPIVVRVWIYGSILVILLILSINSIWFMIAGDRSTAMFSISQPNLLANSSRKFVLYSHIIRNDVTSLSLQWSPFPIEMSGVSVIVPSPSGSKLLVVRNGEKGSPTKLEVVDQSHVGKNIHVSQSIHGPLYSDEW